MINLHFQLLSTVCCLAEMFKFNKIELTFLLALYLVALAPYLGNFAYSKIMKILAY